MRSRRALGAASLFLAAVASPELARAEGHPVQVVVPDGHTLQYVSFWAALGGQRFAREGVTVEIAVPPRPADAAAWIEEGRGDAFVLPPPLALELAEKRVPFVAVANLLRNDPINLIVRAPIAQERGLRANLPLRERLLGLKGLRVGVAPGPPPRLAALYRSAGLAMEEVIEPVLLPGALQNDAFRSGRVDALYAHTPYLERALHDDGAVMLVHQSGGEVPAVSRLQIHTLAVRPKLRDEAPEVVAGMVRALADAEHALAEGATAANLEALRAYYPDGRPELARLILGLYAPAIPITPDVSAEGLAATLPLFPAKKVAPPLAPETLAAFVDNRFAAATHRPAPERRGPPPAGLWAAGAAVVALVLGAAWRWSARRGSRRG